MISSREGWYYIDVKKITCIIERNNIQAPQWLFCITCFHYFRAEDKLESHKKVCVSKDFCIIVMPLEDNKILELNQHHKSDKKHLFIQFLNL